MVINRRKAMRSHNISIGQVFTVDGEFMLLAQTSAAQCALICLNDGNRWCDPVEVSDICNISHKEMLKITDEKSYICHGLISYQIAASVR
jgi:hypothetical protein